MNNEYDYIIIGAGPTGLTLAHILSQYNNKILIIERDRVIGGCHSVKRVSTSDDNLFSEHGPRIYVDNYITFKQILNDLSLDWNTLFTKYHFNLSNIGGTTFSNLSVRELFYLTMTFFFLNQNDKYVSMEKYMNKHHFTKKGKEYIDNLCRLTDGLDASRYTLYQFIQLLNQNAFYTIYQPKIATDKLLFKRWKQYLAKNNVDILLNSEVVKLNINNNVTNVIVKSNNYTFPLKSKKYILAIPPRQIAKLLPHINDFAQKTDYIPYICITFHWTNEQNLKKIWGFPKTSWGIAFVNMSDYLKGELSGTIISTAITKHEVSPYTNKVPNECNRYELANEVLRQLRLSYPNLSNPDYFVMNQNRKINGKWISDHTAFGFTKYGYLNERTLYPNLFTCGTHNGHHTYSFTTLESAISNAVYLANMLEPNSKNKYKIKRGVTVKFLIIFLLLVLIIQLL